MNDDFLNKKINERKAQNAFRQLRLPEGKIDFCSNDYLGLVKNDLISRRSADVGRRLGSTGSRLLSGNYLLIEETEKQIADFHEAEAGLIFNSGYDANVGLLSCVPQRGDTILYDYLSHASIRDGIRLSFATSFSFAHNDVADLEKKLTAAKGNIFVVTESVFSMDGDIAPLHEIIMLCEKYHAQLIIDEAHATGVVGEKGAGLVQYLGLQKKCFARVHTFGKAVGCHGAIVLGSENLKNYLINFSRAFIYTTALPEASVTAVQHAYNIFPELIVERNHLQELIAQFQQSAIRFEKLVSTMPIQVVIIPGNEEVKKVAVQLQEDNFDVRPIVYPTVPKGSERLRIVLHSFNTVNEVDGLIERLR
ncbi:MAG: pyridoxal phosphate-dependent aminotransferase family protein [Bacteroidetes bacterium]|nr:pyridoxal phosphate-dependent aminotransferase family protein [Bacteroidota bacterium]